VTRRIIGVTGAMAPDPGFFSTRRHPDDAAYFEQKFQAVLDGDGTLDVQYRFRRPDDKIIWLHVTATCSFDETGKPVRMVGSLSDVTARREFEAEREHLITALAQSNRELDQFAYVASHDLKAPLRVIDNASTWLEEDLADKLDDESRENLDLLRNRVRRMDRLLDDLLEYSRVGRKTDSRWLETATGAQMQEEVLALVPSREGFQVIFNPSFANIRVTIMPLKQILINLIGNALKHHDRDTGQVVVKAEQQGRKYLISVIDDGPGIPDEFREQIFKMFQTLRPRDRVEGSGMGLAIVNKHIDVLGEGIRVERAGERGSIFCFTYPRSTEVPRSVEE
jgi:two-component system, LuxR family, sensor kinase FixL